MPPRVSAYLEVFQVGRHSIRADLVPFDNIATVFRVATHGACAVTLVEAATDILGCKLDVSVATDGEDLRRPHDATAVGVAVSIFRVAE